MLAIAAMIVTMLTGCMAEIGEISINEDGSGTIKMTAGFTKESLELIAQQEGGDLSELTEEYKPFVYNGVTYYGETQEETFSSLDELQQSNMEPVEAISSEDGLQILPVEGEYGKFKILITLDKNSEDLSDMTEDMKEEIQMYNSELSEEELAEIMQSMVIILKIKLPSNIRQIQGGQIDGITIDKDTLTFDIPKVSSADRATLDEVYEFTNSETAVPTKVTIENPKTQRFSDVNPGDWCYDAIEYMAESGIVNGVGNGKFDPNSSITYAQFCQIIAGTFQLPTGEMNDYWAYTAINSCIDEGYISSRGDINSTNYSAVVTREVATAGIYRAYTDSVSKVYNKGITAKDIPDYDKISPEYRDDIVNAYDIGLTNGVDENRTFNAQSVLTRAQVCQLIYNVLTIEHVQ